jgi:hypothetical protein
LAAVRLADVLERLSAALLTAARLNVAVIASINRSGLFQGVSPDNWSTR